MRVRYFYLLITMLLSAGAIIAQPVIQKIEPQASFPKTRILISGSGFSSTPAQLQVWFDQVRGDIISSSEFSIEVEVPAQARLNNITVVNLSNRLSTQSGAKYMPVFNGEGFDPAKLDAPLSITSSPNRIFDLITADVDGDKRPDIIGSRDENTSTSLALLMNTSSVGNISFANTVIPSFALNAPSQFLAVGELNGDGKPDLVVSRSGATASSVFVLVNTSTAGNPSFAAPITLNMELLQIAREVEIEDINGDGKPDIIVANGASNELYIFRNESSGGSISINATPTKVAVTGATNTLSIQAQDLDGDRKSDIIATQVQTNDIYILKNNSTTSSFNFTISKVTAAGSFNDISTADFNKDGKLDMVVSSLFNNEVAVFLNQSTNTSIAFTPFPKIVPTDAQPFGVDVSDLNGDGFPDFIVGSRGVTTLNAFIHNKNISDVGFTKVVINTSKTNWYVRAGDLDGDAKPDIAFTSFSGTNFSVDILRNKNCHVPKILNEGDLVLCSSQTIRLRAIPLPGITYEWSNGFNIVKSSTDPFLDATVAATYTVAAKSENGACTIASAPITIQSGAGIVPTDPVITAPSPICVGSALTLSTPSVSGATYSWKGPNNFTSSLPNVSIPGATIANAGIYSLTVKVGDCSSNTVTKQVDVLSLGSFSISSSSGNNSICQGQSLTLTVNSQTGYTYQWLKNDAPIAGQTSTSLNVTEEGAYKVNVSNTALSCSQSTNVITVVIYLLPSASFTIPANACIGNTIKFINNSTVDTRVTSVIYSWDFGDNASSVLKEPDHVYTTAQTFNPKLTVSYSGVTSCTSSINKNIAIASANNPTLLATKPSICPDGSETSTLSVTGTFNKFTWSTGATTPTIDVIAPGDYTVDTVDPGGCAGKASITIEENAPEDCGPPPPPSFPMVFTPNGDSQNDRWVIPGIENKTDCTMNIFDGRGRKIFEVKGYPIEGWDGNYDGKEVPAGTYYFVFSCPDLPPTTGSVLVVR